MKHRTAVAISFLMIVASSTARADVVTDWNATTNALLANDVGNNPNLRTMSRCPTRSTRCRIATPV